MSVPITPGSGVTMAADQVGTASAPATGQYIQYVKLDAGAAGVSAPVAAATPLPVQAGDGTNLQKSGSATNLAAGSSVNAMMVVPPGQWSINSAPAVNTQATASQAAGGAGVCNVCTYVFGGAWNDSTGSASTVLTFNLRDGATGAGTVKLTWTTIMPATAGFAGPIFSLSGLNIKGTANTAMTIETSAAPSGAHTAAFCGAGGYLCA
jgi:hypothetical protein